MMEDAGWLGSDALCRALCESAGDYMWVVSREGRFLYVNGPMEKLFGLSRSDILGKTYADMNSAADNEDFVRRVGGVFRGETVTHE